MSDILLTSSRSSLPTSSDTAAVEEELVAAASPSTRGSDSARGDSIDSWPSAGEYAGQRSTGDLPERSCSLTDVAVAHGGSRRQVVPDSELEWQTRRRAAGAPPPRTGSLNHGISMDPGATARDEVHAARQQKRRRTDAGSAEVQQRHRRRENGGEQRHDRRHKSRSLTQMTTVDEEQLATTSRLEAPAFTGSAV